MKDLTKRSTEDLKEAPPITKEEADKRRAEITKYYESQIPHLKVHAEYEQLMASIEESRAKRLQSQAFLANAYEAMDAPDEDTKKKEK